MSVNAPARELALPQPQEGAFHELQIFDDLPAGFLAIAIDDHCTRPLIEKGEIAVVDIGDRDLYNGALYLRRIVSSNGKASLHISEAYHIPRRWVDADGNSALFPTTWFVPHNRRAGFADGPWPLEPGAPLHPRDTIVGRVVGLLRIGHAQ